MVTWNELRHFHRQQAVVALWRRLWGPVLSWLTPNRRRLMLALGAVWIAATKPFDEAQRIRTWFGFTPDTVGLLLVVLAVVAFVWMWYRVARQFASLPPFVRRHPQLCLHGSFWVWMTLLWNTAPSNLAARTLLAGCALVLPFLLWRLGFMLSTAQRGGMAGTQLRDHWFYMWPVWGGTNVPYGKGLDYLASCEAKDDEALARSQLAGIKLFLLAAVCTMGEQLIDGLVFGEDNAYRRALGGWTLGVSGIRRMIATPGDDPIWKCWVAIYGDLFRLVFRWGSESHGVIGILRLGGFNVFRNVYKPLLAETIVEFWNRYYYYFKELLVSFFFFPTYTRYFKRTPRLRVFAAVFAAACFGNMYYHVINAQAFALGHWAAVWTFFHTRLVYCSALALGIYVSMRREQLRPKGVIRPPVRRAAAVLGVWTFFALIHLWATGGMTHAQRFRFLLGLLGLG